MPVMPRMKSCVDDRVHVKSTCWLVSMPVEKPLALCWPSTREGLHGRIGNAGIVGTAWDSGGGLWADRAPVAPKNLEEESYHVQKHSKRQDRLQGI